MTKFHEVFRENKILELPKTFTDKNKIHNLNHPLTKFDLFPSCLCTFLEPKQQHFELNNLICHILGENLTKNLFWKVKRAKKGEKKEKNLFCLNRISMKFSLRTMELSSSNLLSNQVRERLMWGNKKKTFWREQ